jgi:flagellar FliJ protein
VNRNRLASLLRLRRVQQDRAAAELARAAGDATRAAGVTGRRVGALAGAVAPPQAPGPAWTAALAARAALGAALVEARQLEALAARQRDDAHGAWTATRRRTRAVELLEDRARAADAEREARREQHVLDEHAGRAATTRRDGARS